jgi:hypothetical protein
MNGLEPWIDLMASAAVAALKLPHATVDHPALRLWPCLERRCAVTSRQATPLALTDFWSLPHQLPAVRHRMDARQAHSAHRQGGLTVIHLQSDALVPDWDPSDAPRQRLLYGPAETTAWTSLRAAPWRESLVSVPVPAGWQLMFAQNLVDAQGPGMDLRLDPSAAPDWLRLRLRPPPVSCIATVSEAMRHHIMVRDSALFGPRGHASIVLPWDTAGRLRLLVRNIRARVDTMTAAIGSLSCTPEDVHYTERGAMVSLRLPAPGDVRDALLHLSLPRAAVPQDDFCDVGAMEFTAEMA